MPALSDAAIVSLVSVTDTPLPELAGALLAHKIDTALQLPGAALGHAVDTVAGAAADGAAHVVDGVFGAHIPIVTVVMAVVNAGKGRRAGLATARVNENLAWDIGAKGGSIMAGAAIGTAIVPIIGTAIGGFVGAVGGTLAAAYGKRRHLRSVMGQFRASCEDLGTQVDDEHLEQLVDESYRLVQLKEARLADLERELSVIKSDRSWLARTFRPSVGLLIADQAVELAYLDLTVDRHQHSALAANLHSSMTPEMRGYAWVAGRAQLNWVEFSGPEPTIQVKALNAIREEQVNLRLAGI